METPTYPFKEMHKYNQGYGEVERHILHILHYHHIGKMNKHAPLTCLPSSFSLGSPTDPVSSEQCVRRGGKKEKGNDTCPFPLAQTPLPHRN